MNRNHDNHQKKGLKHVTTDFTATFDENPNGNVPKMSCPVCDVNACVADRRCGRSKEEGELLLLRQRLKAFVSFISPRWDMQAKHRLRRACIC
jgi:hypothetical protein